MSAIFYADTESSAVAFQPMACRQGRCHTEIVFINASHCPVINYLAKIIAPTEIADLPDSQFANISDCDVRKKGSGIGAVYFVFEKRRDIYKSCCVPKGKIFSLMASVV